MRSHFFVFLLAPLFELCSVSAQCQSLCPCPPSPPLPNPSPSHCCPLSPMPPSAPSPCCPSAPPFPLPQSQTASSCCVPSASPPSFPTAFPSYAPQPYVGGPQKSLVPPVPSYPIGMPEFSRAMPLPVPIPAKERFSAHEIARQKSEEAVKDPFEKEAKTSSRDEPLLSSSKYATAPASNAVVLPPIIYPTSAAVVRQSFVPQQSSSSYNLQPPFQQQQHFQPYQQAQFPSQQCSHCQCQCSFTPSPRPFTGPQIPTQNCCVGCSPQRQCWTRMKRKRMFGLKTLLSNGTEMRKEIEEEEGERQCNDASLKSIVEQSAHLTMAAAKEAILKLMEEAVPTRWGDGVFCAPKYLEFAVKAERFCTGAVADGICFAFSTKNE